MTSASRWAQYSSWVSQTAPALSLVYVITQLGHSQLQMHTLRYAIDLNAIEPLVPQVVIDEIHEVTVDTTCGYGEAFLGLNGGKNKTRMARGQVAHPQGLRNHCPRTINVSLSLPRNFNKVAARLYLVPHALTKCSVLLSMQKLQCRYPRSLIRGQP